MQVKTVLLCYSNHLFRTLQRHGMIGRTVIGVFGELHLVKGSNTVAVARMRGIGAPDCITKVEEFIAYGVQRIVIFGKAGSLQPDIAVGDVVVCDRAIRDEGTSHHYARSQKFALPSVPLTKRLAASLRAAEVPFHTGTTWTIDTPYRETVREVARYRSEGVMTVEMEAAALFVVAKLRQVQAGAVFVISDVLGEKEWRPEFKTLHRHRGMLTIARILLRALA